MEFILFVFDRIASAPSAMAPIANMVIAMTNVDPLTTPDAALAVTVGVVSATIRNVTIFKLYIAVLVVTALVVTFFTWLVWDAGNKVQDAVQADADARILEARNKATSLEGDLNTEKGKVLGLQKDASDAKAAQQRVEIELEGQKVRTALAEQKLMELQPRTISPEQRKVLVELLSPERIVKAPVLINSALDGEAWQFGDAISSVLKEAGFPVSEMPFGQRAIAFSKPGAFIWIKDGKHQPKQGGPIAVAFSRVGINLTGEEHPLDADVPDLNTVVIAISSHP